MNLDFEFKSPDHLRYESDNHVSGPHGGAGRVVKVEMNINGCDGYRVENGDGYIVTVFNLDGNHPIWKNNVQMAAKPMRIVSQVKGKVVLRGFPVQAKSLFGWVDFNGEDYGLTINLKNDVVENCILHMHDRNVAIEYLKVENERVLLSPEIVSLAKSSNNQHQHKSELNVNQLHVTNRDLMLSLFNPDTIEKVNNQFTEGQEAVSIDCSGMNIRLFKSSDNNINFEFLLRIETETNTRVEEVWFFKPIGYYTLNDDSCSSDLEVTILKEFENDLEFLLSNNYLSTDLPINKLSLEENGVLAAFSMETRIRAEKNVDDSFIANGLHCDIYISEDGFPQVFLGDRYGLLSQRPIAAYFYNGPNTVNAMINNLHIWRLFKSMNLMTVYKNAFKL